jgi:hypothetical protein
MFRTARKMAEITAVSDPILGVTHLLANGELTPLLKCPFCNSFRNIHVEVIEHHIQFTHPGKSYQRDRFYRVPTKSSPYGTYLAKEQLKLQWIRCLWCNYRDKIEWDLAQHMFEKHRKQVYELPISSQDRRKTLDLLEPRARLFSRFEPSIEFRLDVAVMMSKKQNRNAGIKHAIRQVQKRILRRQQEKERDKDRERAVEPAEITTDMVKSL